MVSAILIVFSCFCDFCNSETPGASPVISPAGFQFLLMDTASQVWYFMIQYLETVEVNTSTSPCVITTSVTVCA